jgi:hypothetical protein
MALKVGTEDKKKVYMAAGLGAVMLILLLRFLWQNFGPSPAAPPSAAPPAVTEVRPATGTSATVQDATPGMAHQAPKVGGLAALVRRSRWSTPAVDATSSPNSRWLRRYPNRSLRSGRRMSIRAPLRRHPLRRSTWDFMATPRKRRVKSKSSCCMEMTSSSLQKEMWSIAATGSSKSIRRPSK